MHGYVRFFFEGSNKNHFFSRKCSSYINIYKTTRYLEGHSSDLLLGPTPSAPQRSKRLPFGVSGWDLLQQILHAW